MKALIEKLAAGNSFYETPDVEISENRIAVELDCNETYQGEISIASNNGLAVKGVVFTTDSHVKFANNQFDGINNKVQYTLTAENLYEGQICDGTISVVTTGGDYAIPFAITVKKKHIESTIGDIQNMEDFVRLVKLSYDEALLLFLSKEFRKFFLVNDSYGDALYEMVMNNYNRSIALEEFLVGMKLKERVAISLKENIVEYADVKDNYGGIIELHKNTWGFVDVTVETQGDFFYNCRKHLDGNDFNGKVAEYNYFINAAKLHGGSNHGKIIFKTSEQEVSYDIVIVNQKSEIKTYIDEKKSNIGMIKNYLNFRTGVINGEKWMEEMDNLADERLAREENDIPGLLAKAQISIVRNDEENSIDYLNKVSKLVGTKDANSVEEYCYYLYLKTLHKNNPSYTDDIKVEIKNYFDNGHDTWQILWLLFYVDDRYDDNPSLKFTLIKRLFNEGCLSPVMYFEAANVLNKQPELLRVINQFEKQVLNFAAKYHITSEGLAKQTAAIMIKEKTFDDSLFMILTKMYDDSHSKDILNCICSMIINGDKQDKEYFKWLEEGINNDLHITNLYEYYIYTSDTSNMNPLHKFAYKYFAYGTATLMKNRDYFYANLIKNIDSSDELYERYLEDLQKFATEQILMGNNNILLKPIYEAVLCDQFVVGEMPFRLSEINHTYMITVENENIAEVRVKHKELDSVETAKVIDNVAYVHLYTKNPVISFVDNTGRYLMDIPFEKECIAPDVKLTGEFTNEMTDIALVEKIVESPADYPAMAHELKNAIENPRIRQHYKKMLTEFVVDYYYKNLDRGDLDIFILQIDLAELTVKSRNKIMEILIERNFIEMVYPHIAKYGYRGISKNLLEKLCVQLVQDENFDKNEILVEMSAESFRNGCRDNKLLEFIGKYYNAGTLEFMQIFLAAKAKKLETNIVSERMLIQYIFEAKSDERLYEMYNEYLKFPTTTKIRKAFYTYVTYNYFIKKMMCPDIVWEILEQEYENGLNTPMINSIAFVEAMSKRDELTPRQIKICQKLINALCDKNINFQFYKKFNKYFKIPFSIVDKTVIDFRTNPKHRVDITYEIKTQEGKTSKVKEAMGSIYQGVFTKEVIMFYGEEIDYSITEYSDECPQGKVVDNYSVRISEKNEYNDETRFGMVNGMMICKALGREDAAKEIMHSYQLYREAGSDLFKLL